MAGDTPVKAWFMPQPECHINSTIKCWQVGLAERCDNRGALGAHHASRSANPSALRVTWAVVLFLVKPSEGGRLCSASRWRLGAVSH